MVVWQEGQSENIELQSKEHLFYFSYPSFLRTQLKNRIESYTYPFQVSFLGNSAIVNWIQITDNQIIIAAIPYSALVLIGYILKWVIVGVVALFSFLSLKQVRSTIKESPLPWILIVGLIVLGIFFIFREK